MSVLSVDLAYKTYDDIGVVTLEAGSGAAEVDLVSIPLPGTPAPAPLAGCLDELARARDIGIILIDGPQGWKAPDSPLLHSRTCEQILNTPAKTGVEGSVKPANYAPFVRFSIHVFDSLAELGWRRLDATAMPPNPDQRVLVESFPLAAWRSLGVTPLPSKRKSRAAHLVRALEELKTVFPLSVPGVPTHDQLQAIVSGLGGLALEAGDLSRCELVGLPPRCSRGIWHEGYIVNPKVPPI